MVTLWFFEKTANKLVVGLVPEPDRGSQTTIGVGDDPDYLLTRDLVIDLSVPRFAGFQKPKLLQNLAFLEKDFNSAQRDWSSKHRWQLRLGVRDVCQPNTEAVS